MHWWWEALPFGELYSRYLCPAGIYIEPSKMLSASEYGIALGLLFISLRRANVWEPSVRRRTRH